MCQNTFSLARVKTRCHHNQQHHLRWKTSYRGDRLLMTTRQVALRLRNRHYYARNRRHLQRWILLVGPLISESHNGKKWLSVLSYSLISFLLIYLLCSLLIWQMIIMMTVLSWSIFKGLVVLTSHLHPFHISKFTLLSPHRICFFTLFS